MDFLVKIKSFCLLGDVRSSCACKQAFIGTFEDHGCYGWFMEGKDKKLLIDLLWQNKQGIGGRPIFPYSPRALKKIHEEFVDYEAWFPVVKKSLSRKPDRQLGWSRINDLSFELSIGQIETLIIGPLSIFTVLCYEVKEESIMWSRAIKIKEKKNAEGNY